MRGLVDQLIIGKVATDDDFGASVAIRNIGNPPKKKIKKSVPFSNIVHDFSKINGQLYWEERTLEYVFEMIADCPARLEDMKTAFSTFIMNVTDAEIHDPFIPDYHFRGTYDSMEYADEEHELKTTATVTFTAYPYKIANKERIFPVDVPASGNKTLTVKNPSAHRITPTVTVTGSVRIVYGNGSYAYADTVIKDSKFDLEIGANEFYIENVGGAAASVVIAFRPEVF